MYVCIVTVTNEVTSNEKVKTYYYHDRLEYYTSSDLRALVINVSDLRHILQNS